jgi:hypothetical protein
VSGDVIDQWLANGTSGFGPLTQAILATQNPTQTVTEMYGIVPTQAFWRAVVNAIASLESG